MIVDEAGNSLEYLGDAEGGLASGVGGMIARYRERGGAFYFEGSFRSGVPDGTLRVEEPGQKTRARTFRAGKDAGGASPNDVTQLVF